MAQGNTFSEEDMDAIREGIRTYGVRPTPIWQHLLPHRARSTVRVWTLRIARGMHNGCPDIDEDEAEGRALAVAARGACDAHLSDLIREHGSNRYPMAAA